MDINKKFYSKYKDYLEEESDLYANKPPSFLFPVLMSCFGHLLEEDPKKTVTDFGVKVRKPMHEIIQLLGPHFLPCKHVFENRKQLENPSCEEADNPIILPKQPVIWAPNHNYREDPLASLLSVKRSAYILIGNPARTYNDIDGIPALINGVIVVNRRNKKSRHAVLSKCERVLELGSDLIMFPEGINNKTPNALSLHLFSGIYQIAKATNTPIIPVIHYKEELDSDSKKDIIHTVIDDPIDISNMSQEEALLKIRETYAYWKYLMMEKYGKTTREELIQDRKDVDTLWEEKMEKNHSERYDIKTEKVATYFPKREREYYQALDDITNLEITPNNIHIVEDAKKLVKSQFQRRI